MCAFTALCIAPFITSDETIESEKLLSLSICVFLPENILLLMSTVLLPDFYFKSS